MAHGWLGFMDSTLGSQRAAESTRRPTSCGPASEREKFLSVSRPASDREPEKGQQTRVVGSNLSVTAFFSP
jgi:hypothetical protein